MRSPVAREVWPFAVGLIVVAAIAWAWEPWAAAVPVALLCFCLWFFRDPDRTAPDEPGVILAPADGKILKAGGGRVSVFMNLLNVHVCRAPISGRIAALSHVPGRFLAAFREEAPEKNERLALEIEGKGVSLRWTLIAGLLARRIVCWVREDQSVRAGERVGLIRFGSRVDVELPPGATPSVRVGDRVVAGVTIIARCPHRGTGAAG
jgi:phosphatidylserine decarboxylase